MQLQTLDLQTSAGQPKACLINAVMNDSKLSHHMTNRGFTGCEAF